MVSYIPVAEKCTIKLNNIIETLIFCSICLSGWCVIIYSIFTLDIKFALYNTPIAMYLAYMHTLLRFKLLR